MTVYTCPMHPEIKMTKMGKCPKCGMKLVDEKKANSMPSVNESENSYRPLVIIVCLIILVSFVISQKQTFSVQQFISNFMTGFFIVFSAFKLMDLKGFAEGYSIYDLLAKRWFGYGYIYPFIELLFGLAMILNFQTKNILIAEVIIMTFSGVGVALKLLKHEKFQCACLGTFLKVPLTKVTLVEDFGMSLLALVLLFSK